MLSIQRRKMLFSYPHYSIFSGVRELTLKPCTGTNRPLKPEELEVLRNQFEKEGDMVGIQVKFNYAWVRLL